MKYQFDIKFAARKYTTNDGKEKTYWSPHGTLWIESDQPLNINNLAIKIDSIPQSANWEGYFRAFARMPKEERRNDGFASDNFDDVPFN